MNLKQLQHFVALADSGNMHRGSAALNISQPALSKSIRTLEQELGVLLFERLSRGMRLTPVGQWLRSRSSALLSDIQQVRTELDLIKRQTTSTVRIAAGTVLCARLIPLALARLHQVAAKVQVVVEAGYWDAQKHMLLNGEVDFFVADARELEDSSAFEISPLPAEPIGVYVRAAHPLAKRKRLTAADLQELAFTGLTKMPQELARILRDYPELPPSRPAAASVASNDFGLLRASALLTDLVFFAPPSTVQEQVARQELVRLPLELPGRLQTHFAVIWLKGRHLSTSAELLKHAIMECAEHSCQPVPLPLPQRRTRAAGNRLLKSPALATR